MSNLIITGVIDGPLTGGTPKAIELYALNDIADLSIYGIEAATNGSASTGVDFTLTGSATAGDYIYVASETTQFNAYFGFNPTFVNAVANINGDDTIILFENNSIVDVFGEIGVDGTGRPWEHLDGWAYRNNDVDPSSTFNASEWTFSGVNALDDDASNVNATATPSWPIGTFTAGGTDTTAPTIATLTPVDDSSNVVVGNNLQVQFSENVQKGTGNIVIKQSSDNAVVETIDVTSAQVTVSGSTVTINPTNDLANSTGYYVEIAAGAIEDIAGNDFAGISGNSTWNFTTAAALATPTVNLSVSSNTGTEAGTTAITVTATASSAVSGAQTVNLAVTGTGITAGDYTLSSSTITIPNGQTTGSVTFTIVDDALVEGGTETAVLTISTPSASITLGATTSQNIVITDNDVAITKIHGIQGNGDASALVGQTVTIEAIVVGDFQDGDSDTSRNLRGFYVQEENIDADGNALTSEGLFIFDGASPSVAVSRGDKVQITGTISEFFGETQLTPTTVTVISSGNSLPTAANITLPAAGTSLSQGGTPQPDLEAFEGMLVNFTDTLTINEMFQLDRFNEIKLVQGDRPQQFTQFNDPDVAGYAAHREEVGARTTTYDDGLSVQNALIGNLDGFGPTFSTASDIRMGDTITGLSGVLSYQ